MVLNIDDEMGLKVISNKINEGNVVKFIISQKVKRNPIVLRIESITMLEYVPVINSSAKIPDKFDVCSNINVSAIINVRGNYKETNKINIRMKGA